MISMIIFAIIGFIITLLLLVTVHEFGHFWVARRLGVKVLRFSIGFGRPLFQWKDKQGIEYVIGLLPLGGYVKLLDEDEAPVPEAEKHLALGSQSALRRIAIVIAGPVSNFLLAILLYWGVFVIGLQSLIPIVGEVVPNSIAAKAGLKPQQEIVSIDRKPILSWTDARLMLMGYLGDKNPVPIELRDTQTSKLSEAHLDLSHWKLENQSKGMIVSLGINPYVPPDAIQDKFIRTKQYSAFSAIWPAIQNTVMMTELTFTLIGKLILGKVSLEMISGPIGIAIIAGQSFSFGFVYYLGFLAMVSISLAVINVLPVPVLDGGYLFYYLIEFIFRRPLSKKVQLFGLRLGLLIVLGVMIFTIYNDVFRLFT
ncbi:MAG: RIP metalloprotease RseP [Proteobacteria bacterium]|nr:RIP metalloprotease RseP [Pseudomonadota bacterium]